MPEASQTNAWRRWQSLPKEAPSKMLVVAMVAALLCAVAVSTTAVLLKPRHQANLKAQAQSRMLQMVKGLPGMAELLAGAEVDSLATRLVDLDSGNYFDQLDPANYDFRAAMSDPDRSTALARNNDLARIGRRPKLAPVYLLHNRGQLMLLVLPVYGSGYQSTIHAYLALNGDLKTVAALHVYEQGETPGIGTRITDPAWQALWPGTPLADEEGVIRLSVARGRATEAFEVDGISGATRSSQGVGRLLQFWLGEHGYGPYLKRLASEGARP